MPQMGFPQWPPEVRRLPKFVSLLWFWSARPPTAQQCCCMLNEVSQRWIWNEGLLGSIEMLQINQEANIGAEEREFMRPASTLVFHHGEGWFKASATLLQGINIEDVQKINWGENSFRATVCMLPLKISVSSLMSLYIVGAISLFLILAVNLVHSLI